MGHFAKQNIATPAVSPEATQPKIKEFIHPTDFRDGWNLKTREAAKYLCLSEVSLHRYNCGKNTRSRTEPTKPTMRLAATQSEIWIQSGQTPAHPNLIFE